MFSYASNSCHRNHNHYTLCAHHQNEEHNGEWKTCAECRSSFATEDYVWYGTNEYNFENLPDPPSYEPTKCAQCATIISLSKDEIQSWEKTISTATAPTSKSRKSGSQGRSKSTAEDISYRVTPQAGPPPPPLALSCGYHQSYQKVGRSNEDREHKRGQR